MNGKDEGLGLRDETIFILQPSAFPFLVLVFFAQVTSIAINSYVSSMIGLMRSAWMMWVSSNNSNQ